MVSISSSLDSAALVGFATERGFVSGMEIGATNVNSRVRLGPHLVEIHPLLLNLGISL